MCLTGVQPLKQPEDLITSVSTPRTQLVGIV